MRELGVNLASELPECGPANCLVTGISEQRRGSLSWRSLQEDCFG